jgi:hypothetical protein
MSIRLTLKLDSRACNFYFMSKLISLKKSSNSLTRRVLRIWSYFEIKEVSNSLRAGLVDSGSYFWWWISESYWLKILKLSYFSLIEYKLWFMDCANSSVAAKRISWLLLFLSISGNALFTWFLKSST